MDEEKEESALSAEEAAAARHAALYPNYPPHTNSEMQGNPSKHSAFASTTDGISNRELSLQNPVKVIRCTAIARSTGKQCGRFSIRGGTVCVRHGGQLENVKAHAAAVVESAKLRLINLSDMAVDTLEDLAQNGTAEQIRLKASTEILDRSGIRGGSELDLSVEVTQTETAADRARAMLAQTAARLEAAARKGDEDVLDVEEVDDEDES